MPHGRPPTATSRSSLRTRPSLAVLVRSSAAHYASRSDIPAPPLRPTCSTLRTPSVFTLRGLTFPYPFPLGHLHSLLHAQSDIDHDLRFTPRDPTSCSPPDHSDTASIVAKTSACPRASRFTVRHFGSPLRHILYPAIFSGSPELQLMPHDPTLRVTSRTCTEWFRTFGSGLSVRHPRLTSTRLRGTCFPASFTGPRLTPHGPTRRTPPSRNRSGRTPFRLPRLTPRGPTFQNTSSTLVSLSANDFLLRHASRSDIGHTSRSRLLPGHLTGSILTPRGPTSGTSHESCFLADERLHHGYLKPRGRTPEHHPSAERVPEEHDFPSRHIDRPSRTPLRNPTSDSSQSIHPTRSNAEITPPPHGVSGTHEPDAHASRSDMKKSPPREDIAGGPLINSGTIIAVGTARTRRWDDTGD